MSTVVRRTFRSIPHRNAHNTWTAIVALLTQGRTGTAQNELMAVAGVASSLITDQTLRDAAIIVTCDGPRTRIYCIYDDDAIDGGDANEDKLPFDLLSGDWAISLPCAAEELDWVSGALKKHSTRITARDRTEVTVAKEEAAAAVPASGLVLNTKGFLGS